MSTTYHSNAALKATRPQHGTVAIVSGFYTMGDGGHGMYVYDANSNFPDDGGIILEPTVGSGDGRWKQLPNMGKINVKTFGAKFNWTQDDTTFIQAGINACLYWNYKLQLANGNARTTAELQIGIHSADPNFNQSSFEIVGHGISSDPNAGEHPGPEGSHIRLQGTEHRSIIAYMQSTWRFGILRNFTVSCETKDGAEHGILWEDTRWSQFKLYNVHSHNATRAASIVRGTGLNGEFVRFQDCSLNGVKNALYMDSESGQAFGHYLTNCTYSVGDGGAIFEIGGGGLGFGIYQTNCHSSNIGSAEQIKPIYNTMKGVTYLRNRGISGYFGVKGGRHEHVTTLIENISASYNEAGRITFDTVEFDGMTCTKDRLAIKTDAGWAGSYGVSMVNCSLNSFKFGFEDQGVFSVKLDPIDGSSWKFENTVFNFAHFDTTQAWYNRFDFYRCYKSTAGRLQPFSNRAERAVDISERTSSSNIRHPQGRPNNLLKHSGFTVDSNVAPSPWVQSGPFAAPVKAFPDPEVAVWSSSASARLIPMNWGGWMYQDIAEIDFMGGEKQAISGHITGYLQALIEFDGLQPFGTVTFQLENSVTGKIYDKQSFDTPDHSITHLINLVAVEKDTETSQKLRFRISTGWNYQLNLKLHYLHVTQDPLSVFAPTGADPVDFQNSWDMNAETVRIQSRLQIPVKPDSQGSAANLPDLRAGEIYFNGAVMKIYNGSTWITLATV